jgi:hypothetical protein
MCPQCNLELGTNTPEDYFHNTNKEPPVLPDPAPVSKVEEFVKIARNGKGLLPDVFGSARTFYERFMCN